MVKSLSPIITERTSVLVLGSMPGELSLRLGQYYAHPRNRFWSVMGELLGFQPSSSYAVRRNALEGAGVGLWDVISTCERSGSLDGAIVRGSEIPNELAVLAQSHPRIKAWAFNGEKAFAIFSKLVAATVQSLDLDLIRLPSTSPANASWPITKLVAEWRRITPFIEGLATR